MSRIVEDERAHEIEEEGPGRDPWVHCPGSTLNRGREHLLNRTYLSNSGVGRGGHWEHEYARQHPEQRI